MSPHTAQDVVCALLFADLPGGMFLPPFPCPLPLPLPLPPSPTPSPAPLPLGPSEGSPTLALALENSAHTLPCHYRVVSQTWNGELLGLPPTEEQPLCVARRGLCRVLTPAHRAMWSWTSTHLVNPSVPT